MLIPAENVKDLEDVPQNVRDAIAIVTAEDVRTVLETALCEMPSPRPAQEQKAAQAQVIAPKADNRHGLHA